MSIIICSGRNKTNNVAINFVDNGILFHQKPVLHSLKLHIIGYRRKGLLSHPHHIALSPIPENDLGAFLSKCISKRSYKKILTGKINRSSDYYVE